MAKDFQMSQQGVVALLDIQRLLNRAQTLFATFTDDEQRYFLDFHIESCSLNHCIRWGVQAVDDLVTKVATAKKVPECDEIWVTLPSLPSCMRVLAYSDGSTWNGFEAPYFDLEAAQLLATHIPGLEYDATRDVFTFVDSEGDPEDDSPPTEFPAMEISVDGNPLRAYAIGSGYWSWEAHD